MSTYTWNIRDEALMRQIQNGETGKYWNSFKFKAGGFMWYISIYPNAYLEKHAGEVSCFIYLAYLPHKIKSVDAGITITIKETNTEWNAPHSYKHNAMSWGFQRNQVKTAQIKRINTLTISAIIDIYAVHDVDDGDITDQFNVKAIEQSKFDILETRLDSLTNSFEKLAVNVQQLQIEINDVKSRMNEEQKHDDHEDKMDKMMMQIQEMQQKLNILSTNNNMNPQQQRLKAWLEGEVGLPQYFDIFIENGIDDLSIASLLTMETIKEMGIDKVGHRMKIIHCVGKLNQKKNEQ